jgi:acyl dehydratase
VIAYDALKAHRFAPVVQSYTARDARLYALGLNIGRDPTDPAALRFAADDPPEVVATMPMALARLGPWMRDPAIGIDYTRVVVGEVALRLHAPLAPDATVRGEHRILRVTDKGAGRGALVTVGRMLHDARSGQLLAEFEQVSFCRGDGGFAADGRHDPAEPAPPWEPGTRPPDAVALLPTAPQQALVYRLSGDMNPLHADPEVARRAGFDRPILHGLATMGMAGHALSRLGRGGGGMALRGLGGRLAAPVYPGETLRLEVWRQGGAVLFRVLTPAGREAVALGRADVDWTG